MRFMISFGRFAPVLVAVGLLRRWSYVEIEPSVVRVRMSWAFQADIPTTSIGEVALIGDHKIGSVGVHGWRGRWLVNGSLRGLVTIAIEPSARFRTMGIPLRLDELTLSMENPDKFIAALRAASTGRS